MHPTRMLTSDGDEECTVPASVDVFLRHVHTHKSNMLSYEIFVFREFCGNR